MISFTYYTLNRQTMANRPEITSGWGSGEWGVDYLTGMGGLYGGNERVSKLDRRQLYNTVNALNVTELYTLKWLIVGNVNFFLQFKKKKRIDRL